MTKKDHIMNILRDVAKEGSTEGREYLEAKAEQILSYIPEEKKKSKKTEEAWPEESIT